MKTTRRTRRKFSMEEKVKAVLSIWTERRNAAEICREMAVSWSSINQWQDTAMEGMMTALSPKKQENQAALSPRLAKLLTKKLCSKGASLSKLEDRLKTIQQKKRK